MHSHRRSVALTFTLTAVLLTAACTGSKVTTQASSELPRYPVKIMVLLPFTTLATPQVRDAGDAFLSTPQSVRRSDISLGIPSSAELQMRQVAAVPGYAADKLTQMFWSRLRNRQGVEVLSPKEASKAIGPAAGDATTAPESVAAGVAAKMKADAALIGQVLVYQERSGSRLGANPPATVGFEVKAVAPDGQVLWTGNYYERQKPLTQDFLGFIHHGGVFVTAEELAQYGTEEVLKAFPFGAGGE